MIPAAQYPDCFTIRAQFFQIPVRRRQFAHPLTRGRVDASSRRSPKISTTSPFDLDEVFYVDGIER